MRALLLFCLLLGITACSRSPEAATPVKLPKLTVTHDWVPEPENLGYDAVHLYGYWKEAGIEAEMLPGGPNADIEKRVAMDPLGLGLVRGDSVFLARERGLPLVECASRVALPIGHAAAGDPHGSEHRKSSHMTEESRRSALLLMMIGSCFAMLRGCASLTLYEDAIANLPQENFLTFRGYKVHVEECGNGPPLLLLHGFAASTYSFHKLVPLLAGHFRVVAMDYYGFGYTERPKTTEEFGINAQLELIRHVMKAKRMGPATVLGHSYGGTLALLLAESDRNLVERLVLISAASEFGEAPAWVRSPVTRWLGYHASRLLLSSSKRFRELQRRAYYRQEVLTPEVAEAYRARLLIEGLKETYFAFTAGMASGASPPLNLNGLELPVLVMGGRHDRIVPLESARRLAAALPDAQLLVLEQSGHSAPEEEPATVAAAIRKFAGRSRGE